jgi:hypothetical protein
MAVLTIDEAGPLLRREYQAGRLIPFLGAGFSKPLDLPSWSELVAWMAERLHFEPQLFELHGRADQLAEYFDLDHHNNLKGLVHEMIRRFESPEAERLRQSSKTHRALAHLGWHTIYTTNYDSHVEGALRDAGKKHVVRASLEDFQMQCEREACEVIKFHGTLADPETIVLTESSYFERMLLEGAADQRLRSDLLSNSFLFIGYSFSDTNIRYIWYRMHRMRQRKGGSASRSHRLRCFFATHGVGPVQPALLDQWNIDVIRLDPVDVNASVADLLTRIGRE